MFSAGFYHHLIGIPGADGTKCVFLTQKVQAALHGGAGVGPPAFPGEGIAVHPGIEQGDGLAGHLVRGALEGFGLIAGVRSLPRCLVVYIQLVVEGVWQGLLGQVVLKQPGKCRAVRIGDVEGPSVPR